MNGFIKYFLSCAAVLCLTAAPARAQTDYYNADTAPPAAAADDDAGGMPEAATVEKSHTVIVTSIEKCYAQIGRAATLEIERNFTKPYEECRKRLALKLKAQQQLKAGRPDEKIHPAPQKAQKLRPMRRCRPRQPLLPPMPTKATTTASRKTPHRRQRRTASPPSTASHPKTRLTRSRLPNKNSLLSLFPQSGRAGAHCACTGRARDCPALNSVRDNPLSNLPFFHFVGEGQISGS